MDRIGHDRRRATDAEVIVERRGAAMKRIRIEVVDREYAAVLAAKTPAERFAMIADSYRTARMLVESGVRLLHPDWTDSQIRAETARRMMNGSN